jgi:2-oxoglutarate ferredoxin oxidoreductase subunit alpha
MSELIQSSKVTGLTKVNDFVVKFANVNGSGSASANGMFAKAVFRMGIPISPHNIFPSNIQGLPTWFEVRINKNGYLGRREGVDLIVAMNEQTIGKDIASVLPGGYVLYDSSKILANELLRDDVTYLLNIDFKVLTGLVGDQFRGKEKLILPNIHALELGHQYASDNFECPLNLRLEKSEKNKGKILMDGNTAAGLGSVYGGATVAAWYPLTPSTSVVDSFAKYCKRLRIDAGTGKKKYSIVQAEDELAAIGIAIGAGWNGARAFTATSGPGISLMQEFLGLAYFSEVPIVLFNIQRVGPSTGMPTRSQQGDLLCCAYASHGDTKHVLLFPANPSECFDYAASAFDISDRIQSPVIVMSDLELGMNEQICDPLNWDDKSRYDRGKVLNAEQLEEIERYGRYLDSDGDGIPYRTYPGTHPHKGSYFTRGSSHDSYAAYTEDGTVYAEVMDRLTLKMKTAVNYLPEPEFSASTSNSLGLAFIGTTNSAINEVLDNLAKKGITPDTMRIRAFPFHRSVTEFFDTHELVFVIEQNRDAQLKSLLKIECNIHEEKMHSILSYDGVLITAQHIEKSILDSMIDMNASGEIPA